MQLPPRYHSDSAIDQHWPSRTTPATHLAGVVFAVLSAIGGTGIALFGLLVVSYPDGPLFAWCVTAIWVWAGVASSSLGLSIWTTRNSAATPVKVSSLMRGSGSVHG